MKFASALTTTRDFDQAVHELSRQILPQMQGKPIDLALVFVSPHFRAVASDFSERLRASLNPTTLLGSTAEGVISREQEIEQLPAATLVAAHLPHVEVTPFSLQSMHWEELLADEFAFTQTIDVAGTPKLFLLLADPFTTPMELLLNAFNRFYPDLPVVGGMASGSTRAGGNALFFNEQLRNNGAVGVALGGNIDTDVIVSQGCRPIGHPLTVTRAKKNLIYSLEGQPPLTYLQTLVEQLSTADRDLLQHGLFIGKAIAPHHDTLGRGDFLIRGVLGIDQSSGAMVVGDYIGEDETVQFHLRDAVTAEEDLEMMLAPQLLFDSPSGALLFSCNGRGTHLYSHPNGDISIIQNVLGDIDLAGFFCAGEIGPISGKNFLHGHTASLVLFRPASPPAP